MDKIDRMECLRTAKVDGARRAQRPGAAEMSADASRRDFIDALDAAWQDVDVTEWEADFIESVKQNDLRSFTPAQRASIDRMRERYRI